MNKILRIDPSDNVIVALKDLAAGEELQVEGGRLKVEESIPAKHKLYLTDLPQGGEVYMYGVLVGKTTRPVKRGGLMSTANLHHAASPYGFRDVQYQWQAPDVSKFVNRTFNGYHRPDGRVGTANYWLFIPTVFCENRNLDVIREAMHNELGYAVTDKYKQYTRALREAFENRGSLEGEVVVEPAHKNRLFANVDGIKFLNHQGGCGGTRQDSALLEKLLVAY
ncbi:MAG: UxaA family hydrolase, partial [Sphingobacteriales bacterium]